MARPTPALLQGTLDVLVLKALSRGPNRGYGESSWIQQRSDGELVVEDAAGPPASAQWSPCGRSQLVNSPHQPTNHGDQQEEDDPGGNGNGGHDAEQSR